MRRLVFGLAILAACAAGFLLSQKKVLRARSAEMVECTNPKAQPNQIIEACTAVISGSLGTNYDIAAAYCNRCAAYDIRNMTNLAILDFEAAANTAPGSGLSWKCRGQARLSQGAIDEAIAAFDNSLKLNPGDAAVFVSRGLAYRLKGGLKQSISDYSEIIRLDPKDHMAFSN